MARSFLNSHSHWLLKFALTDFGLLTLSKRHAVQLRQLFYICALTLGHSALADARCDNKAATLESVEGTVEWTTANEHWQQAARGDTFCYGDKIRILEQRAALRLANDTIVRLQENSVVTLMPEDKGFWIELIQGAGHFLSRTPKQLTIKAAYLNAAIDGTEFVVTTEEQSNRVAVFEGDVRVFNRYGEVRLGEGTETSATATTAPDPARSIRLRDAAEWILHYPPLIIQYQTTVDVSLLMGQEQYGNALKTLTQQNMTSADATLAASLALVSGQPSEADRLLNVALQQNPRSSDALALQALKTLTAGDNQTALSQTTALLQTDPENISVLLAHAYALQSQGEIEDALKVNRQTLSLNPDNLFILARTAELELSTGNTRAARKLIDRALQKAPNHSRVNTLAGFIALNRFANKEAQTYFRTAIASNDSEPLARLGLALALIQKGKIEQGQAEMEMAVLLDPGSSLLRSYLGKTYAAQDQNDWADTQYQLAKNLDPNDPTPWFYQAHLKHEENKPGEALRLITRAIEKNDNRAVYRSRMLLDSDAAARSANLVGIYNALGTAENAKNIAASTASKNPTDFAGHQALVIAYSDDSNAQVLRAREALIARLQSPIGAKELNIGVGETGLQTYPWISPSRMGTNEYISLFSQRGLDGSFTSFLGSQESKGYEWQLQAIGNQASLSGGQYIFKTDGYRMNNQLDVQLDEAVLHYQATQNLKLLFVSSRREETSGDLTATTNTAAIDETLKRENKINTTQVGFNFELNPSFDLVTVASHYDANYQTKFSAPIAPGINLEGNLLTKSKQDIVASQLTRKFGKGFLAIGGTREEYRSTQTPEDEIFSELRPELEPSDDTKQERIYAITRVEFHSSLSAMAKLGIIDIFDRNNDLPQSGSSTEYEFGLTTSLPDLKISTATWQSISGYIPRNSSLENNHIFDIPTTSNISGFMPQESYAVNFTTSPKLSNASLLLKRSNYDQNFFWNGRKIANRISEDLIKLMANRALNNNIALYSVAETTKAEKKSVDQYAIESNTPQAIDYRSITIGLGLNEIKNLKIQVETQYIFQTEQYLDTSTAADEEVGFYKNTFEDAVINLNLHYKIHGNLGKISLEAKNLSDRKVDFFQGKLQERIDSIILTQPEVATRRSFYLKLEYYLN